MYTKLTLNIDHSTIETAKLYAKAQKKSVSKLVADYLSAISGHYERGAEELGPLTRELVGVIRVDENVNYKDLLTEALMEKYV